MHAFTVAQIEAARRRWPGARIIVHPETPAEVLRLADAHGSTAQIMKYVEAAPDGATIIIGTEFNLVSRLARRHQARLTIAPLQVAVCPNMALTTADKLRQTLEQWPDRALVRVPPEHREGAGLALRRMLDI